MAIDQASKLRQMKILERRMQSPDRSSKNQKVVRISVTSGKGGVGKSNFALNTSIALANFGKKVLLIDADTNLANLDILIGINPPFNLSDVITGDKTMSEIILVGPGGIGILPGSSGMFEMLELEDQVQRSLIDSFAELEKKHDFVIIDTGAGLTHQILSYAAASDEVIVVTNKEPTSIADAYAMIKVISQQSPTVRIQLLVNMVRSAEEGMDVFDKMNLVVQNFLSVPITYLGFIPSDGNVGEAVSHQVPFITEFPKCSASIALRMTTRKLMRMDRKAVEEKSQSLLGRLLKPKRSI